jgi:sigma-B regulation protein RsbU (phosphoserine phosphatase)
MTPVQVPRTLIADDQTDVLEALSLLLKGEGYDIDSATSPDAVLEKLKKRDCDVLLMDMNYARDTTSGQEGLSLLSRVRDFDPTLPVVVMTAWGTLDLAVDAIRLGVGDFVQKPWDNSQLLGILRTQIEHGRTLRKMVRNDVERDHDFKEAREIQEGFLPDGIPQIRGCKIAGAWQPARLVGGDYYDVLKFDEDTAALCIADVVGKGMPAALLMSNLQAAVRSSAEAAVRPDEFCKKVNHIIWSNIGSGRFITFFYCVLDAANRTLGYTNAGHCPPVLLHQDGTYDRLRAGGAVLGAFSDWEYEYEQVEVRSGDRIVLFTDGVSEARTAEGEEFGEERLVGLLLENVNETAAGLQSRILSAVSDFTGGDFQDDATLLVVSVEDPTERQTPA